MRPKMIYSTPFKVATLIMYTKEIVIRYKSEPLNGISYKFSTYKETLDVYGFCLSLMERLEKKQNLENIEIAFKKMIEMKLED